MHIDELYCLFNALRLKQNGRHLADNILKWVFLYKNVWISTNISLKSIPNGQSNNNPELIQIMSCRLTNDKPLSEPMMVIYWCIYVSLGLNELTYVGLHDSVDQFHNNYKPFYYFTKLTSMMAFLITISLDYLL